MIIIPLPCYDNFATNNFRSERENVSEFDPHPTHWTTFSGLHAAMLSEAFFCHPPPPPPHRHIWDQLRLGGLRSVARIFFSIACPNITWFVLPENGYLKNSRGGGGGSSPPPCMSMPPPPPQSKGHGSAFVWTSSVKCNLHWCGSFMFLWYDFFFLCLRFLNTRSRCNLQQADAAPWLQGVLRPGRGLGEWHNPQHGHHVPWVSTHTNWIGSPPKKNIYTIRLSAAYLLQ